MGQESTGPGGPAGETAATAARPALASLLDQAGRQAGCGSGMLHFLGSFHDLHSALHSVLSSAGPAGMLAERHQRILEPHARVTCHWLEYIYIWYIVSHAS